MAKTLYRVGEGANLEALPRGTRIGDTIHLTEAEALYERDMGRLIDVEAEKAGAAQIAARAAAAEEAAKVVPGETQGHPVDAVTGEPMILTDEERARLPAIGPADGPAMHGFQTAEADGIVKTAVTGDTLTVTEGEADALKIGRD